jgi:hypothetical protein
MNFNNDEKQMIANKIKCISEIDMKNDYEMLKKMVTEANTKTNTNGENII